MRNVLLLSLLLFIVIVLVSVADSEGASTDVLESRCMTVDEKGQGASPLDQLSLQSTSCPDPRYDPYGKTKQISVGNHELIVLFEYVNNRHGLFQCINGKWRALQCKDFGLPIPGYTVPDAAMVASAKPCSTIDESGAVSIDEYSMSTACSKPTQLDWLGNVKSISIGAYQLIKLKNADGCTGDYQCVDGKWRNLQCACPVL